MVDNDSDKKTDPSRLKVLANEWAELAAEREVIDAEFQKLLEKHQDLKQRMASTLDEIEQAHLKIRKAWHLEKRGERTFLARQIPDLINGDPARAWTNAEIFKAIESTASRTTFNATLNRLLKSGKIERVEHGKYRALSKSEDIGIDSQ